MLKHIESQSDYEEFKQRFISFLAREELEIFSPAGDDEPHFGWSNCECCSRPLGGDREKMIGITAAGNQFIYEVCIDCLYYNEYGRLDDMTMLDHDLS